MKTPDPDLIDRLNQAHRALDEEIATATTAEDIYAAWSKMIDATLNAFDQTQETTQP